MSNKYFAGGATPATEVDAWVWSGLNATDIVTFTAVDEGGNTLVAVPVTIPATPTSTNTTTAAVAAWAASPAAVLIGAAGGTTIFTVTSGSSGVPMHITATTSGTSTATKQTAGTNGAVANAGPLDWGTASNWSDLAVPITGDTVTIDSRSKSTSIIYGLNQSGVTLAALYVQPGAPLVGQQVYALRISGTNIEVPRPTTNNPSALGVARFNINTGTNACNFNVQATNATPQDVGQECVRITGANASNALTVSGGLVGLGTNSTSDTPNFPTITYSGGTLNTGFGVVAGATLNAISGVCNANHRPTSGNVFGILNLSGLGGASVATLNFGGNVGTASVGTAHLSAGTIQVAADGQISGLGFSFGNFTKISLSQS